MPTENRYDKCDIVRREAAMIADCAGQLKLAAYRVRDPDTNEWSKLQFHFTHDNTVLAVMGEEAAKLFSRFVTDALSPAPPKWNWAKDMATDDIRAELATLDKTLDGLKNADGHGGSPGEGLYERHEELTLELGRR